MEPPQDGKTDDVFIQRRGGRKDRIYDQSRRYSRNFCKARGNGYELYRDTIKLFDYGFKNYKSVAPFAGLNCDLSENQENPVTQMACKLSPYQLPLGGSLSDFSVLLTKDQDSAELKVYTENNKIYASYGDEDLGSTKISY